MKKILKGQIYFADLDPVVGSEQNGYRPVLILQNNIGNSKSPTTIIAPITKQTDGFKILPIHIKIKAFDKTIKNSIVLLEQIRTIDKSRLKGYVCTIDSEDLKKINKGICISLNLE